MGYSYVNYTGNGVTRDYTFPFSYLSQQHVRVYVQGVEMQTPDHWSFTGANSIQFTAPATPLDGEIITIKRVTSLNSRLVNFTNGSILDEATQNTDSKQAFYLVQEAYDVLNLAGEDGSAYFTSRESIISALNGWIDDSMLTEDLRGTLNYLRSQWTWTELFAPSTTDVYESGVYTDRIAEDHTSLEVLENEVQATVATVDNNVAILSLMSDQFYVKLDANGYVAGFGLYNDETGSEFIVNVDKFGVIKTDGTGIKKPFVIDTSTGNVGVDGNLIVTGSVTAGKLAVDSVVAENISITDVTSISGVLTAPNGEIVVSGNSSIVMTGDDDSPGNIEFRGTTKSSEIATSLVGTGMAIRPLDDTHTQLLQLGYWDQYGLSPIRRWLEITGHATQTIDFTTRDASSGNKSWLTLNAGNSTWGVTSGGVVNLQTAFRPVNDNSASCGADSYRWTAVWAVNGTIQASDARDKEAIVGLDLGLDFIKKLRPVTYQYIGEQSRRQGLIAQEVEEVLEGVPFSGLIYNEESDRYGLNYSGFVPSIILALQEQSKRLERIEQWISGNK